MELWKEKLQRRIRMQSPGFDMKGYCKKERRLRSKIRSAKSTEERELLYRQLRAHLGIPELR